MSREDDRQDADKQTKEDSKPYNQYKMTDKRSYDRLELKVITYNPWSIFYNLAILFIC